MKYNCVHCRTPFNTEPYVKSPQYGVFCRRTCWEEFLSKNGEQSPRPKLQLHTFNRGNHIKRRN